MTMLNCPGLHGRAIDEVYDQPGKIGIIRFCSLLAIIRICFHCQISSGTTPYYRNSWGDREMPGYLDKKSSNSELLLPFENSWKK